MTRWKSLALVGGLIAVFAYSCSRGSWHGPWSENRIASAIQHTRSSINDPVVEDAGVDATVTTNGNCTTPDCGVNGVWLGDGVKFRTLHLRPDRVNEAGLSIIGFLGPHDEPLTIDVQGDVLRGTDPYGKVLHHDGLDHARLLLGRRVRESQNGAPKTSGPKFKLEYTLTITSVMDTPFWAQCTDCKDPLTTFPSYGFLATDNKGQDITLCAPGSGPLHSMVDKPEPINMVGSAVIFRGDYYDDQTHEVTANPTEGNDDLFNIACFGTVISKLHLLRHTTASQAIPGDERNPSVADRQTLLRLFSADYCGNGSSFTENGMPIDFGFNSPIYTLTSGSGYVLDSADSLEALWTSKGALCIASPRLLRDTNKWQDAEMFISKIRAVCARSYSKQAPAPGPILPDCSTITTASLQTPYASGNYAISGNPQSAY